MLTEISASAAIGLLILVIYLIRLVIKQKRDLSQFQGILDIEIEQEKMKTTLDGEKEKINAEITKLYQQRDKIQNEQTRVEGKLVSLNRQLSTLEDEVNIQNYGLYQPKYDLGFSTELKSQLDLIRKKQKAMIREKTAIVCSREWTVDGNRTEGRKMTNRQIQLMARAFNGECDSIISKVKYNNVMRIVDRMTRAYDAINKLGENRTLVKFKNPTLI